MHIRFGGIYLAGGQTGVDGIMPGITRWDQAELPFSRVLSRSQSADDGSGWSTKTFQDLGNAGFTDSFESTVQFDTLESMLDFFNALTSPADTPFVHEGEYIIELVTASNVTKRWSCPGAVMQITAATPMGVSLKLSFQVMGGALSRLPDGVLHQDDATEYLIAESGDYLADEDGTTFVIDE